MRNIIVNPFHNIPSDTHSVCALSCIVVFGNRLFHATFMGTFLALAQVSVKIPWRISAIKPLVST